MKLTWPAKIYVEARARGYPLTERVLARAAGVPCEVVEDSDALEAAVKQKRDPIAEGKRILLLKVHKGKFLRSCPAATVKYTCCNYYTLQTATGCNLDCSYCFLQAYLTNPITSVYVNTQDLFAELDRTLAQRPGETFRIGTGELSDSLSMDRLTGLTRELVPYFAGREHAILELKTKSAAIENLLDLDPKGRTVVSWSITSDHIQRTEEWKTAGIGERLAAAAQAARAGYRLAFHFDPLIGYDGWQEGYRATVERLFAAVPTPSIAWISLGTLRLVSGLREVAEARFPKTPIFSGEFLPALDGRDRYFKPLRIEMYRTVAGYIRAHAPQACLYLCMESPEIWERALAEPAMCTSSLTRKLDASMGP